MPKNKEVEILKMTKDEVVCAFKNGCKVALLPFGSIEQHGSHLPLGTDTLTADEVAVRSAQKANSLLNKPFTLVYPAIWFGNGGNWTKGELWLKPTILITLLKEIYIEILDQGFEYIIVVNVHGGNTNIIAASVNEALKEGMKPNVFFQSHPWSLIEDKIQDIKETEIYGHACEIETSTSLYLFPELVKLSKLKSSKEEPKFWNNDSNFKNVRDGAFWHYRKYRDIGKALGHIGNPKRANEKKGKLLVDEWIDGMVGFLSELHQSLE